MASNKTPSPFVLHIRFASREDGGLRAWCDKVPNFLLSHKDPQKVHADIVPALQTILSEMYGLEMRIKRLPEIDEAFDQLPFEAHIFDQETYLGTSISS
ncbi:MAG: hypothetical protein HKN78_09710 [Sphingomonadaceae bacterium]|nr:hypothetical protein [Sphingomonadaceae bacterium]